MAQISLRIDDDVKSRAEQVCAEIGIPMTTAITIFLKKVGREQRIPFDVSADPFYSNENMERLRTSIADKRPPVVKTMAELEVMADE